MGKDQRLKPGDVCIVQLPDVGMHEQHGRRPAAIITKIVRNVVLVVPFTSSENAVGLDYTVNIVPDIHNHLAYESSALVYQIRGVDVRRVEKKMGELSKADFKKIKSVLVDYLDL